MAVCSSSWRRTRRLNPALQSWGAEPGSLTRCKSEQGMSKCPPNSQKSRCCFGSHSSTFQMNSKTFIWLRHYSKGGTDALLASKATTYTTQGLFHSQWSPGRQCTTSVSCGKICRFHAVKRARKEASSNHGRCLQSSHSHKKWIPQKTRIPFSFDASPTTIEGRVVAEAGFAGSSRTRQGVHSWIFSQGDRSGGFGWRVSCSSRVVAPKFHRAPSLLTAL